jgi:hypothetical protein
VISALDFLSFTSMPPQMRVVQILFSSLVYMMIASRWSLPRIYREASILADRSNSANA